MARRLAACLAALAILLTAAACNGIAATPIPTWANPYGSANVAARTFPTNAPKPATGGAFIVTGAVNLTLQLTDCQTTTSNGETSLTLDAYGKLGPTAFTLSIDMNTLKHAGAFPLPAPTDQGLIDVILVNAARSEAFSSAPKPGETISRYGGGSVSVGPGRNTISAQGIPQTAGGSGTVNITGDWDCPK